MTLEPDLRTERIRRPRHSWTRRRLADPADQSAARLVPRVAEAIVAHQCRGATQYAAAWRRVIAGGYPYSAREHEIMATYVRPLFGLPAAPLSDDHAEGVVAEYVWRLAEEEFAEDGVLVDVFGPKFFATAPGGDGLVIRRNHPYSFRLWEVKKKSTGAVSGTVTRAMRQLAERGLEYLAKYSVIGQYALDPDLAVLYATLADRWLDGRPDAGAGVAVVTSKAPLTGFTRFAHHLPTLFDPIGRRGLAAGLGDLPEFAQQVRSRIWTGL